MGGVTARSLPFRPWQLYHARVDSAQERLQDIDRELDALGPVPERLPELVARYSGVDPGVEAADEALWEIQQGLDVPPEGGTRAELVLDEVNLFSEIETDEEEEKKKKKKKDELQQEPQLQASPARASQKIDSDFKQMLQLDIDPSVFPPSIPLENRTEVETRPDEGDMAADQGDEAADAGNEVDEAQPDIDELDEDFLALLDEDVIELEDE